MASDPIFAFVSTPDTSGEIYPGVHVGQAANVRRINGMLVAAAATLSADRIWYLQFQMPATIPSGTLKLLLHGVGNLSSGNAVWNPSWAAMAQTANFNTLSLSAEGNTTVTFTAVDTYHQAKITLDAATAPTANQIIVMNLTAVDASWTAAAVTTWLHPFIIYE